MKDFNEQLKLIQNQYKNKLKNNIIKYIDDLDNNRLNCDEIFNIVHKLKGSGATFGLKNISNLAGIAENKIKDQNNKSSNLNNIKDIAKNYLNQIKDILYQNNNKVDKMKSSTISAKKFKNNIFIYNPNNLIDNESLHRLTLYNYTISNINEISDNTIDNINNSIIIFDTKIYEDNILKSEHFKTLNDNNNDIIYISNKTDIENRFKAVKNFGKTYFNSPFDIEDILDYIETNINDENINPYNILIVEDDEDAANYYSLVLNKAGMKTRIINNAINVMEILNDFYPDLILLDMYMPGYNGIQLAAIIRQFKSLVSVPIIFLSAEKNEEKQLIALKNGGDDFLTKPISPNILISNVSLKAKRMRDLRSLMESDGLTQLLNHISIKKQLEIEFSRAKRYNQTLSIAMIDIDNFKKINDTYGHLVGDNVLKSLSRLLRKRLRKSDIIGRYGGEEFLIIFVETNSNNAQNVMGTILNDFNKIEHNSNKGSFNVSFSCGIVEYTTEETAKTLNDKADKALYKAKENGKNQIIIFNN